MTTATAPTTRKPGQLGPYEIKIWKSISGMGREGDAFTASPWKDGKRHLAVSNEGNGGCNIWTDPDTGFRHYGDKIDEFRTFAQKALETPDDSEAHDGLIEVMTWLADMEKAVAKNHWPRHAVIEENIKAHNEQSHYQLTDREKAILRTPEILDNI